MLKRFWLVTFPNDRYGSKNFGATAYSDSEARSMILTHIRKLGWTIPSDDQINSAEVIENIDISDLDANHVTPNIGVVSRHGVWYPNLNY